MEIASPKFKFGVYHADMMDRAQTRTYIRGWGGVNSYIHVLPHKFLFE